MTLTTHGGPLFFAAEVTGYRPAADSLVYSYGWGTRPRGALSMAGAPTESIATVRASDMGYRTRQSDAGGCVAYPPLLFEAVSLDRRIMLDPARSWSGVGWGEMRIRLTPAIEAVFATHNSDGRNITLRAGRKLWSRSREMWIDPPLAQLETLFQGIAGPWRIDETDLVVPMRDAAYWLERPAQAAVYGGTGGYDGNAELKGVPMPRARGGTSSHPIRYVEPLLIDPANLIYQYSDGPGTVVEVFEGGDTGYTPQGDTTDLYAGSTSPGQYRTDNSRGLLQLGTKPVRKITAHVTGAFPSAGVITNLTELVRYSLLEDMLLSADLVDAAAFTAVASAFPYLAGYWLGPAEISGVELLSYLMSSMAGFAVPSRDGRLRPLLPRALTDADAPAASWGTETIGAISPRILPAPLDPPPFRWRVGYRRNHTPMSSDLDPDVTAAMQQELARDMAYGQWSSALIQSTYRRPSDPPPLGGALLLEADADAVADSLGGLFSSGGRLYDVSVPFPVAMARDIGDVVQVTYPMTRFREGLRVRIVGERIRPGDPMVTVEVFG